MKLLKRRLKRVVAMLLVVMLTLTNNSILLQAAIPNNYYYSLGVGNGINPNSTNYYSTIEGWTQIYDNRNYIFNFVDDEGTRTVNGEIVYPSTYNYTSSYFWGNITKLDNSTEQHSVFEVEYGGITYFYKCTDERNNFTEWTLFHTSDTLDTTGYYGNSRDYQEIGTFDSSTVPSEIPRTSLGAGYPYASYYLKVDAPSIRTPNINSWEVVNIQDSGYDTIITLEAITPTLLYISAWSDESVLVGHPFEENKVKIKLGYSNGTERYINYSDLDVKPTTKTVNNLGWNNYYDIEYEGIQSHIEIHGYDYTEIQPVYNGPSIGVGKNYNVDDVKVTALYTNNLQGIESKVLSSQEWNPSSTKITKLGSNKFTATLKAKESLTSDYIVPGDDTIVSINATYTGPNIYVGDVYNKEDVSVTALYYTGTTKTLGLNEWDANSLTVSKAGENEFTATCGDITTTYTVPGYIEKAIGAEYHGDNITVGETYDKDDVYVFVYYTNDTAKLLPSNSWQEDSLVVTKDGKNEFTATYKTFTDTFDVMGEKELIGIEATYIGESIPKGSTYDKEKVKVTANYNDGSSTNLGINDWQESSLLVTIEGKNDFVAIYESFVADYSVTGIKPIVGLKASYKGDDIVIGSNYNKSDVEVTAIYHDGSEVILRSNDWQESSLLVTKIGTNNYTASYGGLSANYTVNGINKIESIKALYQGPAIEVGQKYNKDDVIVTAVYSDKSEVVISQNDWIESSLLVEKVGENEYMATYNALKAAYTVTGISKNAVLESITAVYKGPDIETGKEYNKDDVTVTAIYSDGITKKITTDEWVANSLTITNEGKNEFIATYQGLTANYSVNGIKTITGIEAIYTGPDIAIGNNYDKKDVITKAIYHDGSKKILNENDWTENTLIVSKEGKNSYIALYNEFTATYYVTGTKLIAGIEAIYEGEDILIDSEYDKLDVKITIIYHDGSKSILSEDNWQESGLLVTKKGDNSFTATYEKFTDDYIVKGTNPLIGIEAVYEGEDILVDNKYDKSDVKVTAIYHDGTEKELDEDDWKASSLKVKKTGKNKFTATYEGYKDKYTVKGYDDASVVHTGVEHSVMLIVVLMLIFVGSTTVFIKARKR